MKTGILVAILIGIVILFATGMYTQKSYDLFAIESGTNGYSMSCQNALNNFYHGAQPGECIAYALNANRYTFKHSPETLYYVISAVEKQRNCGRVTPAKPTGCDTFCTITISHDFEDTLDCGTAKSHFGDLVCENGYCDYNDTIKIPDSCVPVPGCDVGTQTRLNSCVGNCLDISDNSHVICLPHGKYSGILSGLCPQTLSTSESETSESETSDETNSQVFKLPEIPNYIYILGLIILILILIIIKK